MAFIFTYMMFFLKWAVSSTFKLLSFVFNEMVCNLYFKIVLIFLLLKSGDIEMNPGLIALITLFPFYTVTLEIYVINLTI